jgi:hypothetical protein
VRVSYALGMMQSGVVRVTPGLRSDRPRVFEYVPAGSIALAAALVPLQAQPLRSHALDVLIPCSGVADRRVIHPKICDAGQRILI